MPAGMIDDYDPRSELHPLEKACLADVPQGGVLLDVGACVGGAGLYLLDANPTATVHAFEPNPHNAAYLRELPVRTVQAAVGARPGRATLYTVFPTDVERGDLLGSLRLRGDGYTNSGVGRHDVTVIALDDYCLGNGVGHADLLKIDAEGGEWEVLQGADRLLSEGLVDVIVFESISGFEFVDGYVPSLDDVLPFLADRGYEVQMGRTDAGWRRTEVASTHLGPNVRAARIT